MTIANKERQLAFDFDGVLCDSVRECLIVAYNAYHGSEQWDIQSVPSEVADYFYRNRHLVRPAREYFPLIDQAVRNRTHLNTSIFQQLCTDSKSELSEFEENFFATRQRLKACDLDHWLALHDTFPEASTFLTKTTKKFFVVTHKDHDSVEQLSRRGDYRKRIIAIYSKETSNDRQVLFEHLRAHPEYDPYRELCLVDDNIENLRSLKGHDITLLHASWGYCDTPIQNPEITTIYNLLESAQY